MIKMLWKSCYDANAYAFALKNWRWKFALYFLFLCTLFALATSLPAAKRLANILSENMDFMAEQIPDGKIKGGAFTMPNSSPHFVTLKSGEPVMAFSNELLDSIQTKGLFFSVEKDRMTFYSGPENEQYIFFSESEKELAEFASAMFGIDTSEYIPVNGETFKKVMSFSKVFIYFMMPLAMFALAVFMAFIMMFAISIPVFISSMLRMPSLGYFGALKIALIATTPALICFAAETIVGTASSGGFLYMIVCFVIVMHVMRRLPLLMITSQNRAEK